jgi:hypothetical protein
MTKEIQKNEAEFTVGQSNYARVPSLEAGIARQARRFLERAEKETAAAGDREAAFETVFGHRRLYVSAFPTMEERMAFRDVPFARAELFKMLWRLPARD